MKKFLAWICILSVLLSSGALAASTTLFDGAQYGNSDDNNMQFTFAVANDVIYLFTYASVDGNEMGGYSRVEAPYDIAAEAYQYPLPELPADGYGVFDYYSDGEGIWKWCIADDYCKLYRVCFNDAGEIEYELETEFPMTEFDDEEIDHFWHRFMILGDFFICLADTDDLELSLVTYDMEYDDAEVYEFDDEHRAINVLGMMPYTDETVLVASSPAMENIGEVILYELDPAEEELTELATLPMGGYSPATFGYVYDRENDMLYFMMEGVLYRISGFDPDSLEAVYDLGYLYTGSNILSASHAAAITSDGHYIVSNGETILACDISGDAGSADTGANLKILGPEQEYLWDAASTYVQGAPGSNVSIYNPTEQEFDLTGALASKSDAYDIYILRVDSSEYDSMYQRGYLLPGICRAPGAAIWNSCASCLRDWKVRTIRRSRPTHGWLRTGEAFSGMW